MTYGMSNALLDREKDHVSRAFCICYISYRKILLDRYDR